MDKRERQEALLHAIVQEYIKTARPVGSKTLVQEYGFDFSPATIRNDMSALEDAGFIEQPHTSAGRIPTAAGYEYYIRNFMQPKELARTKKRSIDDALRQKARDRQERIKRLAHTVAALTDEAVVVSLDSGDTFYTGISHMFRKPEFAAAEMMLAVSEAFDQLDDIMQQMHGKGTQEVEVVMGEDNPFSQECSVIITEYEVPQEDMNVTFGILGPMRMDYDTNISIVEYVEELMNDEHEQRR